MTSPDAPVIYIAAALIVNSAGLTLLVRKRGTEVFIQAGGKIEPHESPRAALVRELDEELGVQIDPDALEYLGTFAASAANEEGRSVRCESFYLRADLTVVAAREIEEVIWISPGDTHLPLAPLTRDQLLPIVRERLTARI